METLAFIHASSAYEDPSPAPELRSLDELGVEIPSSALMGVAGAAVALGVLAQAPDAHATLRRGDACAAVGTLQRQLQSFGYSVGGADSVFGNNTEFAVKQFQSKNGLARDGIVGPATASSMGLSSNISCGSGGGGGGGGGNYRVNTNGSDLLVRSGPGTNFPVLTSIPNGVLINITSTSGGWGRWASGGWVSLNWVSPSGGGGGGGGGIGGGSVTVRASALNVRSGASMEDAVIDVLYRGQVVGTTGRAANGFIQLSRGGWIAAQYTNLGD